MFFAVVFKATVPFLLSQACLNILFSLLSVQQVQFSQLMKVDWIGRVQPDKTTTKNSLNFFHNISFFEKILPSWLGLSAHFPGKGCLGQVVNTVYEVQTKAVPFPNLFMNLLPYIQSVLNMYPCPIFTCIIVRIVSVPLCYSDIF